MTDVAQQPERPRLCLKPRCETTAAKLAQERSLSASKNPFGAAKPREEVLAAKTGKQENEILAEEAARSKLNLRLTPEQQQQQKAAAAAVNEAQHRLELASEKEKEVLQQQLDAATQTYEQLIADFERLATEAALSGKSSRTERRKEGIVATPGRHELAVATAQDFPTRTRYNPTRPQHSQPMPGASSMTGAGARSGYHPTRPSSSNGSYTPAGDGSGSWGREGAVSPVDSLAGSGQEDGYGSFRKRSAAGGTQGSGQGGPTPSQPRGGERWQAGSYSASANGAQWGGATSKEQWGSRSSNGFSRRDREATRVHATAGGPLGVGLDSYRSSSQYSSAAAAYVAPNSQPEERY